MKLICFGNLGYVGTVLNKTFANKFPHYLGFDIGYFKQCYLKEEKINKQIIGDVRKIHELDLKNFDVVIYLAALSNDPLGSKFSKATHQVNFESCLNIAKLAKFSGVKKFIFASSCSIYGKSGDKIISEKDQLNPLTDYAKSKINAENKLKELSSPSFIITCLRFATACGFSNRMRVDIVLNNFISLAIHQKKIILNSNGESFRPLIHVNDMVRAIEWACERTRDIGGNFVALNVGSNEWNFKIIDLAKLVSKTLGNVPVNFANNVTLDPRSYRVDFSLFKNLAPNYQPKEKIEDSIKETFEKLSNYNKKVQKGKFSEFSRLEVLNSLLETEKINSNLEWILNP